MNIVWQRARSDSQKSQRRGALLDAASRLLYRLPIDEISLNAIAREANISKANVYRYFESREDLFLQLTLEALGKWREVLLKRLRRLEGANDANSIADVLVSTTLENEIFSRLISVLTTVFERNVSTDVVVKFKQSFFKDLQLVFDAVGCVLTDLNENQVKHLMGVTYFQIVGLWPASHPVPEVEVALNLPELSHFRVDFEQSLRRTIIVTIAGLRSKIE